MALILGQILRGVRRLVARFKSLRSPMSVLVMQAFCHESILADAFHTYMNICVPVQIARLGGIEALLTAMKELPAHPEVQQQACLALYNLSLSPESRAQIARLGAEEQVRRAMAAANATEDTKKWGQVLLDRLARC